MKQELNEANLRVIYTALESYTENELGSHQCIRNKKGLDPLVGQPNCGEDCEVKQIDNAWKKIREVCLTQPKHTKDTWFCGGYFRSGDSTGCEQEFTDANASFQCQGTASISYGEHDGRLFCVNCYKDYLFQCADCYTTYCAACQSRYLELKHQKPCYEINEIHHLSGGTE